MATAVTVMGAVFGLYGEYEQKEASDSRIEQQRINARAVANRRRIAEDEKMSRITSTNMARQAASPFADSSGSFSAVAEGNINQFAEDRNITNLNLANQMKNLDIEGEVASNKEIFGDINSIFSAASSYYYHKELTKMNDPKSNVKSNHESLWDDIWS